MSQSFIKSRLGILLASAGWWDNPTRVTTSRGYARPAPQRRVVIKKTEMRTLIDSMTNWQRNQAGRKCKGRFKDLTLTQLQGFAAMVRSG